MPKKKQTKKNDDLRVTRYIVTGERVCRYLGFILPTGQFVSVARRKAGYGVAWSPVKSQAARVYDAEFVYADEALAKEAAGLVKGFQVCNGTIKECMLRPEADGTLKVEGYYSAVGYRTRKEAAVAARKEIDELVADLKKALQEHSEKRKALA